MKLLQIDNRFVLALATLLFVPAGCQKNEPMESVPEDSIVKFVPSVAMTGVSTKGVLINEDGTEGAFDTSKSFFVSAWNNDSNPVNIIPGTAGNYQEVKMKGSQWNTVYTDAGQEYCVEYIWKVGETKTFYAYANLPASGASVANTAATSQKLTYTVPAKASDQTDILMGFYSGMGETGSPATMTGTASIVFSHPLTAVRFKIATIDAATFTVNSIRIEGVHSSGTAVMTPASAAESNSKDRVSWNTPGTTTTVSQTVDIQPTAGVPAIGGAFLLIPQDFAASSTARIAIKCKIDGEDTALYYPLAGTSWLAGKITTYHLSYMSRSLILTESEVNEWDKQNKDIKLFQ